MIVDCHAHLNDKLMADFLRSFCAGAQTYMRVFSNSVDLSSSIHNLELSQKYPSSIIAFVGFHPQSAGALVTFNDEAVDSACDKIRSSCKGADGIGEIGIDPKYGNIKTQRYLFEKQLQIAESNSSLGITIHARETTREALDTLSRYNIKNSVLFHWFSGTEQELKAANSKGYYVSYGFPALFSKRIARLAALTQRELILAETDSPLVFGSISKEPLTPFCVSSVLFHLSLFCSISYDEMNFINEFNANRYLKRKPH